MSSAIPAEIGMSVDEVDTPALLVDLDALERNIARMAHDAEQAGIKLRPHAKTHKCAVIAKRQMAAGAIGVCCQKTAEAQALVNAGVTDVLVSNEVVGIAKLRRLVALAGQAKISVCVDHPQGVNELNGVAREFGARVDVLVELDVGAARCGVAPEEVAPLAARVAESSNLNFVGLQAYHGSAQHRRRHAERVDAIGRAVAVVQAAREGLRNLGLDCAVITGAGTGTYALEAASGVYTELQAGSYVFMDADYAANLDMEGQPFAHFEHSLFVYTTVMSTPTPERFVVDAGLKAMSAEMGLPLLAEPPSPNRHSPNRHSPICQSPICQSLSDEHGVFVGETATKIERGTKLKLIPSHCDPTVNLHDWFVGVRNNRVEALWPIVARGALS